MGYADEDILRAGEVAAIANVDPKTVGRWAREGLISVESTTIGGHRRYKYGVVMAELDKVQNEKED
jgi:DNA-binding transcriptional MerR regulator